MATRYYPLSTTKKFDANEAVKMIGEYKTGWHSSYNKGNKKEADALQNTNDVGASYIVENFIKNNSAPTTPTATETSKADTTTITGKVNDLYDIQKSDRATMADKYDTLENYNYNHDPYNSKIGKSIMGSYKFQGKTASDNAVASGGANNGGNIDSYAAANANRQQLAFTNAGKQAVLNDFNTRIANAKDILNNLGVYQQNQDKGMQTTIGLHQTEEQRVFENDETSKNNQVDRDVKISEVTGYVPEKWSNTNNFYLDENGNLKPEYEDVDFSAVMANAKKNGNTELYNQASVARAKKIYGNYAKYGKYDDGNYTLPGKQQTESGRQFDKTAELSEKQLEVDESNNIRDNETDLTIANLDNTTSSENNQRDNITKLTIAEQEANKESWDDIVSSYSPRSNAKEFLNNHIKKAWTAGAEIEILPMLEEYKRTYSLTQSDVITIANILGIYNSPIDSSGEKTVKDWITERTWYSGEESNWTPEAE